MSVLHPFQRSFYVLFISLPLIFYFAQLNKRRTAGNEEKSGNKNSFSVYGEIFESFDDATNVSSKEIWRTLKFLNLSFDAAMDEKDKSFVETLEPIYILGRCDILGLFELTTKLGRRNDGAKELMAAKTAVQHVNALNVIPGYKLVLLVNDTQCDPGVAIDRFFHAIYSKNTILMLLTSGCSNVSEALAHIVPYWNIIQISYGSISPSLSDRRKFPLFFRTVSPDSSHNIAKIHFIKHFKWRAVAMFSQSENAYLLPVNHLITELEKENVSCVSTVTFSIENYRDQLRVLKSLDIHIIIGSFSVAMAPRIFCAAFNLNMFGKEYLWILEESRELWWEEPISDCSATELTKAAHGVVMVGDYEDPYHSDVFLEKMNLSSLYESIKPRKSAKHTYDAIWAMSLTLRMSNVKSLKKFNYKDEEAAKSFVDTMKSLEFIGLSGPIRFNGADRMGDFMLTQIQENGVTSIALYDSIRNTLDFRCELCQKIYWKGGQVPIAQRILKVTLVKIPNLLYYTVGGISLIGIIWSFVFLYFNMKFRQMTTIKLSSPNLNNLAVIGCILVYLSVPLFGFHNISIKTQTYFDELCSVKIYFLSAGFSLTFGSMFAKSYRVHRLFTYAIPNLVKDKILRDRQLIGLILVPLFIDTLIMGLWIALDPLERHLYDLIAETGEFDSGVVYQSQVELCLCRNTLGWHIALFGYKTIILIMGVYMAWKTRHVKVPALNESQHIAVCIYSAVFSTLIVIAFSFVTEYIVMSYVGQTLSILASTTITLTLMFLPKLKSIFGRVDTELSIMQSMGLKVQYKTRRFIWDDPREVLCRLEIQNRVYRCELQALDKEISRLEELLRNSSSSSGKSSANITHPIIPDNIQFLGVPRASWPTWHNQTIKPFSSENKLNNGNKSNFLGKLKMFLGSSSSLQYGYNNLEETVKDETLFKYRNFEQRSNPEICRPIVLPCTDLSKIKSESCIRNVY